MDKENTPPPERRGPRAITPPADNERRLPVTEDVIIIKIILLLLLLFIFNFYRMKMVLKNQAMQMIKLILNQVMQKLFEKGMYISKFFVVEFECVCVFVLIFL